MFFGQRSALGTTVVLDSLLNDRLYFIRRHLDFTPNLPDRVDRIRVQQERTRLKSDESRRIQGAIRDALNNVALDPEQSGQLAEQLRKYLDNPSTRSNDLTALLAAAAPDLLPAEVAYEVLERLGTQLRAPRYVLIGGIRTQFSATVMEEAAQVNPPAHPRAEEALFSLSVDDEETVEIDDALSCLATPDGGLRVLIHIALVADWVPKGGAMDREAALRGATVYLPEATVRMLPDQISCERASLIAGQQRSVLTTDVHLDADGKVIDYQLYPATIAVNSRLTYTEADELIAHPDSEHPAARTMELLHSMSQRLREWRRRAGAVLIRRRESKIRVRDEAIAIEVIDSDSPSRLTVAEYMVLSNHLAAQFCAANTIPIIYRVQPSSGGDLAGQHPRLSLFPAWHAGIGLEFYAQLSSPIRRYADLVLQRQILGFLVKSREPLYQTDELLTVLANAESADSEAKDLERRSKRYWALRYLERFDSEHLLAATVLREGGTAELTDYAVRGTLRSAPNLANDSRIMVRIASLDPLRGWLAMEYAGPAPAVTPLVTATGA